MGALRQTLTEDSLRKPVKTETKALSRLDKLRARTDYDKGDGWSALPHAAFVDLLRLSSGEVCFKFCLAVNIAMGDGSARNAKEAWNAWSDFRSTQEWAEDTVSNVRDIQRQLSELEERGMIAVKQVKNGTIKYSVSLLYRKWGKLESYAVWKRRNVVAIDEAAAELAEDESPTEISKDAVLLTKKPARVRPGRASRAVKVDVGVSELSFQNDSPAVDAAFSAVVTSGRLVVSATFQKSESEAKGERKANAERHACRALPTNEGIASTPTNEGSEIPTKEFSHPRAAELVKLFDPILAASHRLVLSSELNALQSACEAVQDCDHDFLVKHAVDRAAREVKSPLHVKDICADALRDWRESQALGKVKVTADSKKKGFADRLKAEAARRLEKYGRI